MRAPWFWVVFLVLNLSLGEGRKCYAQNIDTMRFAGRANNAGFVEFIKSLENDYSIKFYYQNEWFQDEEVTLNYTDVPLRKVIDRLVESSPYMYEVIQDNMIVFWPREKFAILTGNMAGGKEDTGPDVIEVGDLSEAGKYKEVVLSGTVRDGKTGEPLIGATIQIENTTNGVVSNLKGDFSLTVKPGFYTILASNIGFEKTSYKVKVISNGHMDVELFEESIQINEVSVYAQRADKNVRSNQMSVVELDAKVLKQLPSITGEKDIIKSLTMLPGVKSVGEFGSGINVRGGSEDQNLYLIEGAPIFNTSHVLGLISVINPDAVSSVSLYKGHIPAGFGERVSSVMDVRLNDINGEELHSTGGIGLYNSRLMLEGPVIKEKLTFKLGGRTSYSDFLLSRMPDYYLQNSSASFHDINGLIKYKTDNNWISLFGYTSGDHFKYADNMEYEYGNTLTSLSWGHFFNSNLNSVITASHSGYKVSKDEIHQKFEESRTVSKVNYSSIKSNFSYSGLQKNTFDGGLQGILYKLQPGETTPLGNVSLITPEKLSTEKGIETCIYINDQVEISRYLSVNLGLRYTFYAFLGPHVQQTYLDEYPVNGDYANDTIIYGKNDIIKTYSGLEPRISIKLQLDDKNSIKGSYNRNRQYLSLISYTAISTPDDVWKLADNYIKPIMIDQFAVGYYRNFFDNTIETSIEGYVKYLSDIYDYKNGAMIEMNQNIETELTAASGRNYGIELMIKKNKGKLDGWISYTYSRSFIKTIGTFDEGKINNNEFYPSSHDKPNDITLFATYHFNRRFRVSGNFMFSSGRAITLPEYTFCTGGYQMIYYSDRNKYRLPPYHRFDISMSLDESLKNKKKWKGSWTFSILNVYGRKNAYSLFYKKDDTTGANTTKMYSLYKLYIIGKPLPTLTYNFIF
ncbi:MAG: carboxypeptidase-like regulatory domain-containing protein [Bacteroidales bacterium]|nr:carboxypeptidase-like regulatory domain-containing protein [Bacteroidales bacterium]